MSANSWFSEIPSRFPWLFEREQNCILSPDCDGFLCGLLMSHLLGWKVRGFYNGRVLVVDRAVNHRECVFLDMEIYRPDVRSVGQHMLKFGHLPAHTPDNWDNNFAQCISPNNLRNFDFKNNFAQKYPLATVHLLMAILSAQGAAVPPSAIPLMLYVDGTFKNTMNYPENCLDWLKEMGGEGNDALRSVFCAGEFSPWALMGEMKSFFSKLQSVATKKPDKLVFHNYKGEFVNLDNGVLAAAEWEKVEKFLNLLADRTGWEFVSDLWACRSNLRVIHLGGGPFKPRVTDGTPETPGFKTQVATKKPISWAITAADRVEMTWDHPEF